MSRASIITIAVFFLMFFGFQAGCMGPSADGVVNKFISKCQTGDWTGAEMLLSERGKLGFDQTKSLEDTYWPMLGMAYKTGINVDAIRQKLPEAAKIVSSDADTTRGQIRVSVKNSMFLGPDKTRAVKGAAGLKSIDVLIRIDVIQEMNRWKIERIKPLNLTEQDQERWDALAMKNPGSLGI